MARTSDPDSATSQFFITLDDSAAYSLDGDYAGFGYVVAGMDVVDAIQSAKTESGNRPTENIIINSIKLADLKN